MMAEPKMKSKQLTLVRKLLFRGCPVNSKSRAETPLLFATIYARCVACMRVLLEMGADPDAVVTACVGKMSLLTAVLDETVAVLDTPYHELKGCAVETPDTIEAAG